MALVIEVMDMPKRCYSESVHHRGCIFHYYSLGCKKELCAISNCKCLRTKRPKYCPLKEIPYIHGNIKDADVIIAKLTDKIYDPQMWKVEPSELIEQMIEIVNNAPTILEATE